MPAVYALIAAALTGAALVTTQYGLRHMDSLAGAKVSMFASSLPVNAWNMLAPKAYKSQLAVESLAERICSGGM